MVPGRDFNLNNDTPLYAAHVFEPELWNIAPRRAQWAMPLVRRVQIAANIWVGLFLAAFFFASQSVGEVSALAHHGQRINAVVEDMQINSLAEGDRQFMDYRLRYRFTADNQTVHGSVATTRALYRTARAGDTLPVTYLPHMPETHRAGRVTTNDVRALAVKWGVGIGAGTALGGLIFALALGGSRERLRLLRNGLPVVATVRDRYRQRTNHRGVPRYVYAIRYEWSAPQSGTVHTDTVLVSRAEADLLAPGATFTVLTLPNAPDANAAPYFLLRDVELVGGNHAPALLQGRRAA